MSFDNLDFDDTVAIEDENSALPEESSNRTFMIIAGVLGGIIIIAIICIAIYFTVLLPNQREQQTAQKATVDAQNTEVAFIIDRTSTAVAQAAIEAAYTQTPTKTSVPATLMPTSSPTSVVAQEAPGLGSATPTISSEMATATVLHATLTANAILFSGTLTAMPSATTSSAIPTTGFADEVGLPLMLGMAALLIVVVFLARRLRTATS